jgi:DNA-binding beta-propeller fold protein YncE
MRRFAFVFALVFVFVGVAGVGIPATQEASGSSSATCMIVVKKIHGKRKRVRVCKRTPKPALPSAGTITATIAFDSSVVSVASGAGSLWVTTENRRLLRLDPATGQVVASIALPDSEWPENVAFGEGAAWVAVASGDTVGHPELDSVLRVDPSTNAIASRIPVGHSPEGIAFTPGAVWVADHRSEVAGKSPTGMFSVSRVDVASGRETARVRVETRVTADDQARFCCGPQGATAAAGAVWVADPTAGGPGDAFVVRLDPATNAVVATIPLQGNHACGDIAADDEGVWIAAACDDTIVTRIDPHTNHVVAKIVLDSLAGSLGIGLGAVWASSYKALNRIDPRTNTVVARTPIPSGAGLLAIGSDAIWVASGGRLLRIKPT